MAASVPSACCRPAGPPDTRGRPGPSAARCTRPGRSTAGSAVCIGPGSRCPASTWSSTGAIIDGLHVFCAVLAWSRVRFVRFAEREDQPTTLRLLAECFETLGGVPAVVLADRMGCLKGGVVANVVVPAPGYVAFARHYGFRPDFCEAADPESKGVVEHLVGYAKADLVIGCGPFGDVPSANTRRDRLVHRGQRPGPQRDQRQCPTSASSRSGRCCARCRRCGRPSARSTSGPSTTSGPSASARPGTASRVRASAGGSRSAWRLPTLVVRHAGAEVARHPLMGPGRDEPP